MQPLPPFGWIRSLAGADGGLQLPRYPAPPLLQKLSVRGGATGGRLRKPLRGSHLA